MSSRFWFVLDILSHLFGLVSFGCIVTGLVWAFFFPPPPGAVYMTVGGVVGLLAFIMIDAGITRHVDPD